MIGLQDIGLARETLLDLGEDDFDAADFFERFGELIEKRAEAQSLPRLAGGDSAKQHLREVFAYFQGDVAHNWQVWPHAGLRVLAMVAPLHVAQGVLGQSADTLDLAIRSRLPSRPWAWWRALGEALLTQAPDDQVQAVFDLTTYGLRKYRKLLFGPASTQEEAA